MQHGEGTGGGARPTPMVAGATPVIAGVRGRQLTRGCSRFGSKMRKEKHGEEEELTGKAASCVGARGVRTRRRIWRRRLRPDLEKMRAAAVLWGGAGRFLGGEEGGEVGGAIGELGWARGAPEWRGRRWLDAARVSSSQNTYREEAVRRRTAREVLCE